jgi:hypothetical protein
MKILVPQGIGDSIWAIHKIQSLAKNEPIDIRIACWDREHIVETRASDFLKRFKFINSVEPYVVPKNGGAGPVLMPESPVADGYYRYLPDGPADLPDIDFVMMPNAPLERGIRLENWLPELETNWNIMDDFHFTDKEKELSKSYNESGPYAVFFLGSEASNTYAGHNRSGIWKPEYWIELGNRIKEELKTRIIVVGAFYDKSYYDRYIREHVDWEDMIGKLEINETFAVTKNARFIISYQAGIGIVTSYFGVPTGIFWRAKGDSIQENFYLSFEEAMASAWANPKMIAENKHMPLIYGKHNVDYIMSEMKERKW